MYIFRLVVKEYYQLDIGVIVLSLFWFSQALAYFSIVLFIIPFKYLKILFPYAFIGGFIYTWIVQYIAVDILRYWAFPNDIIMIYGIPLFFVLSWFAVTYLYGYILYKYPKDQLWIIIFFVIWATLNNYVAISLNQIFFLSWTVVQTFMFAIFSHVLLLYLLKIMLKVDELGTKENILSFSLSLLKNK